MKEGFSLIITRKYALIPVGCDNKEWNQKVLNFTLKDLEQKIKYTQDKYKKEKSKERKDYLKEKEKQLQAALEEIKAGGKFTQKMINDYTYNLVRTAMEEEARRKNYILSYAYSEMVASGVQYMPTLKEKFAFISEMMKPAYRVKGSKKGSLFDDTEINNILGGYGNAFSQILTGKVKDAVKAGLLEGRVSLPSYKMDSPFTIAKASMHFDHDYDSYEELCEHTKDCNLYLNYGSNAKPTIARFKINLGNGKKRNELITTILRIYSGEYQYCSSSIQISGSKIILNLSMKIPDREMNLDKNIVVGVDLSLVVPAVCAVNNNRYARLEIGSEEEFLRVRTQLQEQRHRLQKALKDTKGGHGRKKKLKALNRLEKREKHFVETYCHLVSRRVVDFAVKNNAKYINMENLTAQGMDKFLIRNWSFYKIQTYIEYKAATYGIVVRKVNPCCNDKFCCDCGTHNPAGAHTTETFICKNEACKGREKTGLYNAAMNIAKSTLFMESGRISKTAEAEAMSYYGVEAGKEETDAS